MRVIAGDLKGRKLKPVPGKRTRPTSDKVKEAVFQMIGPYFSGGICLDLFAGSGALGVEAISRGMDYAVFVDKDRQAVKTIDQNIEMLKIDKQTEVTKMEATRALRIFEKNKAQFNLIFIDPPYEQVDYNELITKIMAHHLLQEDGLIICEHNRTFDTTFMHRDLTKIKQSDYGTSSVTIFRRHKGGSVHE